MRKTIKFAPHLVPLILSGEKTSTWRLFDDKDIKIGDELIFMNADNKEKFATARAVSIQEKPLSELTKEDHTAHEKYVSEEEMLRTFRNYYGERVDRNTTVKIIDFKIINK